MCGIFCYIYQINESKKSTNTEYDSFQVNSISPFKLSKWSSLEGYIARRGPDSLAKHSQKLNNKWYGEFIGSVLWMQGPNVVSQPCTDDKDNVLLWNGDVFTGPLASESNSDTLMLLKMLKLSNNIVETIDSIEGPFSIVYFQKSTDLLYFARDKIGRHSLLIKANKTNKCITLCSVANRNMDNIIELPAIGIFVLNLQSCNMDLTLYPWQELNENSMATLKKFEEQLQINVAVNASISTPIFNNNIGLEPKPEELFPIEDLLNEGSIDKIMSGLLNNTQVYKRVTNILELLKQSVKIRLKTMPKYCKNCIKQVVVSEIGTNCNHPKIGILFSGGLDSTILACIASEFIPINESIDLINVAFEKAKAENVNHKKILSTVTKFDVPDRKTGRQALKELQKICPNRTWNFIEINVSREELQECCGNRICNLIYPLQTVLDESLGCAVWFASRGTGILLSNNEYYESSCRILLLGMGADELFGGYTRHRTTLRRNGWQALTKELETELSRISERNLGRDDRVVSDHGRQSRLPYLDENLIRYVQNLKPWERCYPTEKLPPGLGDKLLLRLLAYKIGLRDAANFPKRAFQFGSRIANSKQNANDVSSWLR